MLTSASLKYSMDCVFSLSPPSPHQGPFALKRAIFQVYTKCHSISFLNISPGEKVHSPHFQSLKLIHEFIFFSPTRCLKLRGVITRSACYKRIKCKGRRICHHWPPMATTLPVVPAPAPPLSPPQHTLQENPAYEAVSLLSH